jgi:hypothetical protein
MSFGNRFCGLYGPGHLVHWIQAKKSHKDDQPVVKVTVPMRWLHDRDAAPDGDTGEPESGYLVGVETPTDTTKLGDSGGRSPIPNPHSTGDADG